MTSKRAMLFLIPLLISSFTLLASRLLQPPDLLRPKIFVIGLSKTGTTSIGDALGSLGYRRLGWGDVRSRHLVHTWAHGNLQPHLDIARYYDAFEDLPWSHTFREMAEHFPDSKFVLSLRKDEETWLRSVKTHFGRGRWLAYSYFYGADVYEGNEEVIRTSYRNHTERVREYFKDKPGRLVELDIDRGDANWDVLCGVAICPGNTAPEIEFPRSNAAVSWNSNVILDKLLWLWGWALARVEERSTALYYGGGDEGVKHLLRGCWSVYDTVETMFMSAYFGVMSGSADSIAVRAVSPPGVSGVN